MSDETPERWARLQELFRAARQLDPGERASFIAASCDDKELLQLHPVLMSYFHNIFSDLVQVGVRNCLPYAP